MTMAGHDTKPAADWRRAAVWTAAGLLAAAGLAATPFPAAAQHRSNNDGRALDANKRVGSGGQNDGAPGNNGYGRNGPMVTGNQIVTGNVTAGRQFRGAVPYGDPANFRGPTSGSFSSDRFVRDSAGVPRSYGSPEVDLSRPTAFYGSGRAAPPPTGYVPTAGATGGYIPTDTAVARPNLGLARSYSPTLDPALRSGELVMPSLDGANRESMLSASPLYGVRVWRAGESPNDFLAGERAGERGDRFGVDPNNIMRMRDELNRAGMANTDEASGAEDQGQGGAFGQDAGLGNGQGNTRGTGLQQPLNQSVGGRERGGAGDGGAGTPQSSLGANALQSSVATGQSIRRNLVAPDRQTPQLARLRQAYERRQRGGTVTDVEAARQFNRELLASRARPGQDARQPGGRGAPGVQPGQAPAEGGEGGVPAAPRSTNVPPPGADTAPDGAQDGAPGTPTPTPDQPPAQPVAQPPEPERIGSIAEGVEAQGLRDVLTSAEGLMREQKFAEALQKYDVAQRVAPNNALIVMGRANAELGASYYRRAETSLRDAVSRAPELVVAQFDLRALIGEERLQVLVRDLKELSTADAKAVRPPLLLAYIAYNTGNEAQAGEYLAAAEERAGGDDALLRAWRRHWKLTGTPEAEPAPQPEPDLNK
jgi:hypothetical protein